MKTIHRTVCRFAALLILPSIGMFAPGFARQQAPQDTTRGLPTLEIPEITIIGKKAITLPFARKGEIFDVSVADVPPPDSTLLETRPAISLPIGALPRYEEPLVPLHISAEGHAGSYGTVGGRAYLKYKNHLWGFDGNAGFSSSQGHVDHSSSGAFEAEARARSIISTDNDFLKAFRVSFGTTLMHDSYGMFGIRDGSPDRTRNNFALDAELHSLDHRTNEIGISLSANIWSVNDSRAGIDSSVSVVSPAISVTYATDLGGSTRLMSGVYFASSALNYSRSVQSPSLATFDLGVQWEMMDHWFLQVGGNIQSAAGSSGDNPSLLSPYGIVRWELDADREVRFWFKPQMECVTYGDQIGRRPYLVREMMIDPERKPLDFGGSFLFNGELVSLEVTGAFAHSTGTPVILADSAGHLTLSSSDANSFIAEAAGTFHPGGAASLRFSGAFRPAYIDGTTTLLPMTPMASLGVRGEYTFGKPGTIWISADYTSKQNTDLSGVTTLGDRVLFGAGASSALIPRTVLSVDISNLLDTGYEWWRGYQAPGLTILLNARFNIQ